MRVALVLSAIGLVSCAAVLGLPDPTLDESIPVGGGSSSGGSSGTSGTDGSPNDDAGGGDGSIDGPLLDSGPLPEGKAVWSNLYSPGGDVAYVACSPAGDIFVAKKFVNTLNIGSSSVTATGSDVVVAKLSPKGMTVWASKIGGTGDEDVRSITVDAKGDVYVAGTFTSQVLDAAGSTATKGSASTRHGYIAKLSGGSGAGAWASGFTLEAADNTINIECRAVRATSAGIAFACPYRGIVSFPTSSRPLTDRYGALVGKIDPTTGSVTTAQVISSTLASGTNLQNESLEVAAVDLDANGDMFVIGQTRAAEIKVGATVAANSAKRGASSAFVMKLKTDLSAAQWTRIWAPANAQDPGSATAAGLRVDRPSGAVYVGGTVSQKTDFGLGDVSIDAASSPDPFIVKLDGNGTTKWLKTIHGTSNDSFGNVDIDPWGRPFFGAYLSNTQATMLDNKPIGAGNVFLVAKLDPTNGAALYASAFIGSGANAATGGIQDIASSPANGHAVATGTISGSVLFEAIKTSSGFTFDFFVLDVGP